MATAQNAEGIILRKYYLRETSYILVIFTKQFGKIRGVLKGARNPYPQFAGNFEIFTLCDLLFYRKKKRPLDLITQCEAREFFYPVRKDIERLTYANYFIELIDVVTNDHDVNDELYEILAGSLRLLASGASPRRAGRIFELKLLGTLGLRPQLDECVACGSPVENEISFSVSEGGLLCGSCLRKNRTGLKVSMGTVNFMRKIFASPTAKTSQIKVSKEVGKEIELLLKRFLDFHINRPVRSLKFLKKLQKEGIC